MQTQLTASERIYRNQIFTGGTEVLGDHNRFKNCTFLGQVNLTGDDNVFLDCKADSRWEHLYCIKPTGGVRNVFLRLEAKRAEKLVLLDHMVLKDCHLHTAGNDALFSVGDNWHVLGTLDKTSRTGTFVVEGLGHTPGAHADGLQVHLGTDWSCRGVYFNTPHQEAEEAGRVGTNSCLFLESGFGPVLRGRFIGNVCDGGNYTVYYRKTGYPLEVRVEKNVLLSHRFGPFASTDPRIPAKLAAKNNLNWASSWPS